MPECRLSRLAVSDLQSIGEYTVRRWGLEQAEHYLAELRKALDMLAANPGLGRSCEEIRAGYRRMEHEQHVVFYRVRADVDGIEVIRILHNRMLPGKYLGKE